MIVVLFSLIIIGSCDASYSPVAQAFIANKIVPNVILTAPEYFINVKYLGANVNLGNKFNPLQTVHQPKVNFNANNDDLYTLVFFGPDVPLDLIPPYTQFLHWMVVNIPGRNLQSGDTVCTYFPPTPYPGGFNYIFLLFKQTSYINPNYLKYLSVLTNRPHFDVITFQNDYELVGPVAGNFLKEVYYKLPFL